MVINWVVREVGQVRASMWCSPFYSGFWLGRNPRTIARLHNMGDPPCCSVFQGVCDGYFFSGYR